MRFEKRYEIGRSAEWVLWRAEEHPSRQLFTVKEIADPARASWHLRRLRDEHDFLANLDHPHLLRPVRLDLPRLRSFFEDTQCSLSQYVAEHGPLQPTLVANVLLQCADALEHLHGRGKGHGAISPHTILVGPKGDVKLGIFVGYGFANGAALPDFEVEPKYQAPELLDSSFGACSPSSDLYCLGYAALELLLGDSFARLFGFGEDVNWLAWHADPGRRLEDWRSSLFQVPEGLLDLIAALIEKDPEKRTYHSASQVRAYLEESRLISNQRLSPFRPEPRERPRRPSGAPARRAPRKPAVLTLFPAGPQAAQSFTPGRPVVVGAAADCDVHLRGATVSRKHAVLCESNGQWWLHDLGSRAGTWVNGERVSTAVLNDGDDVLFGGERCRVRLGSPTKASVPHVGEFELHEQIHEGQNGKLYRAVWTRQKGREAAVRIYPRHFEGDEVSIKRFLRGNPGAGQLRHPNIVRLFRGGYVRGRGGNVWFLAMELLPGGSLRDRLARSGPLSPAEVVRCGVDVCTALEAAAERGLVHRNVNPSAILFDAAGNAKLGDFSLLRDGQGNDRQDVTAAGPPPGEHVYQSPEQLLGVPDLGPACDVYGLAATLYEALTGQPPFSREQSWVDLLRSVCARPVQPPRELNPAIPAALDAVLTQALDKCPQRRFATPGELKAALASCLKSEREPLASDLCPLTSAL
jgi:serine/threonine protein kinase